MKVFTLVSSLGLVLRCNAGSTDPLGKVLELLDGLTAKVSKEGEAEAKAFAEYTEWCDDAAQNSEFAVKESTKEKGKLEAKIAELTSDAAVAKDKIEELAAAIAAGEKDLENAATVRAMESKDFVAAEKELLDSIDTLGRAVNVLEREMEKNPALAQVQSTDADKALGAIDAVLDAAAFSTTDRQKLQSLLQSQKASSDEDAEPTTPTAAPYKTHSSSIIDVLEDLKEKAEGQLSDLRKGETTAKRNFEMLRSSLETQKGVDTKDLASHKAARTEAQEGKATAEGALQSTIKSLESSKKELEASRTTCMTVAADHEATVAARAEELKVIAEAKKVLTESSSRAVSQAYSLVQLRSVAVSKLRSRQDLALSEAIAEVKELARKQHSSTLAQLASRMSAVAKFGVRAGEDPFAKVKGLISQLIEKLESEAGSEATEKAYCVEEMAKTEAKKSDLNAVIAKLSSKLDSDAAQAATLKEEVRVLEAELAAIAKEQAEMDTIRLESNAAYKVAKEDLSEGLTGVRKALRMLRDYYGSKEAEEASFAQQPAAPEVHSKATGSGTSIIGLLEVVESDFATSLAKEEQQESDAAMDYEKMTQQNKITKTIKEQDVKYKTQNAASLDKSVSELSSERATSTTELEAVLEYDGKLKERCIAKPETYEARQARRQAEIEGLKKALATLNDETAFLQRKRRYIRGSALAAQ